MGDAALQNSGDAKQENSQCLLCRRISIKEQKRGGTKENKGWDGMRCDEGVRVDMEEPLCIRCIFPICIVASQAAPRLHVSPTPRMSAKLPRQLCTTRAQLLPTWAYAVHKNRAIGC